MLDIIVWSWVLIWIIVGVKRYPVYFHRYRAYHKEEFPYTSAEKEALGEATWIALLGSIFWVPYELTRAFRIKVVNAMTREEREQAEFEKAQKIVAEYTAKKEREEREAFEQQLRGE